MSVALNYHALGDANELFRDRAAEGNRRPVATSVCVAESRIQEAAKPERRKAEASIESNKISFEVVPEGEK